MTLIAAIASLVTGGLFLAANIAAAACALVAIVHIWFAPPIDPHNTHITKSDRQLRNVMTFFMSLAFAVVVVNLLKYAGIVSFGAEVP